MQHKDIVAELARRLERGEADVEALADGFASLLKEHCGALETVAVPGFGKFEGETQDALSARNKNDVCAGHSA